MVIKLIILALYALIIIVVGIIGMRRTSSFSDFFLGGGKVGAIMSAFSYGTAYFSTVVFIGFAGKVGWGFGYSGIWIGVFNSLVGVLAVWALLGWKVKKMSIDMGVFTLSEFLEKRYNSPMLKLIASIAIFIFLIPYSAAVFIGLSYLFASSFEGLQYWHAVVFMGVFTAVYTVMGGYKSMAMMDTVFGIIMTVGVMVLAAYTMNAGGGLSKITATLNSIDPGLLLQYLPFHGGQSGRLFSVLLSGDYSGRIPRKQRLTLRCSWAWEPVSGCHLPDFPLPNQGRSEWGYRWWCRLW